MADEEQKLINDTPDREIPIEPSSASFSVAEQIEAEAKQRAEEALDNALDAQDAEVTSAADRAGDNHGLINIPENVRNVFTRPRAIETVDDVINWAESATDGYGRMHLTPSIFDLSQTTAALVLLRYKLGSTDHSPIGGAATGRPDKEMTEEERANAYRAVHLAAIAAQTLIDQYVVGMQQDAEEIGKVLRESIEFLKEANVFANEAGIAMDQAIDILQEHATPEQEEELRDTRGRLNGLQHELQDVESEYIEIEQSIAELKEQFGNAETEEEKIAIAAQISEKQHRLAIQQERLSEISAESVEIENDFSGMAGRIARENPDMDTTALNEYLVSFQNSLSEMRESAQEVLKRGDDMTASFKAFNQKQEGLAIVSAASAGLLPEEKINELLEQYKAQYGEDLSQRIVKAQDSFIKLSQSLSPEELEALQAQYGAEIEELASQAKEYSDLAKEELSQAYALEVSERVQRLSEINEQLDSLQSELSTLELDEASTQLQLITAENALKQFQDDQTRLHQASEVLETVDTENRQAFVNESITGSWIKTHAQNAQYATGFGGEFSDMNNYVQSANGEVIFYDDNQYYYYPDNAVGSDPIMVEDTALIAQYTIEGWSGEPPKLYGNDTSYGKEFEGLENVLEALSGGETVEDTRQNVLNIQEALATESAALEIKISETTVELEETEARIDELEEEITVKTGQKNELLQEAGVQEDFIAQGQEAGYISASEDGSYCTVDNSFIDSLMLDTALPESTTESEPKAPENFKLTESFFASAIAYSSEYRSAAHMSPIPDNAQSQIEEQIGQSLPPGTIPDDAIANDPLLAVAVADGNTDYLMTYVGAQRLQAKTTLAEPQQSTIDPSILASMIPESEIEEEPAEEVEAPDAETEETPEAEASTPAEEQPQQSVPPAGMGMGAGGPM